MLQDRKTSRTGRPRQAPQQTLPSMDQIAALIKESIRQPGTSFEVHFGDAHKTYSLTAFRNAKDTACTWSLQKWEGDSTSVEWTLSSSDQRIIHRQVVDYFPSWNPAKSQTGESGSSSAGPAGSKSYSSGNLKESQIAGVLRAISVDQMTGRLELHHNGENALVVFDSGLPVHCQVNQYKGDEAMVELSRWHDGTYAFSAGTISPDRTISKRLDALLYEGAALRDLMQQLDKLGISEESQLHRTNDDLSAGAFIELMMKRPDIDVNLQKSIYGIADGKMSVRELASHLRLSPSRWIPVIHNLVSLGLLAGPVAAANRHDLGDVEWKLAEEALSQMTDINTGAVTYPFLLHLLEREFERSSRYQRSFSLILMELGVKDFVANAELERLPAEGIIEIAKMISTMKRKTDILGHYQEANLALLLPETGTELCRNIAQRLINVLASIKKSESNQGRGVAFSIGFASAPEDARELSALIGKAADTKHKFGW